MFNRLFSRPAKTTELDSVAAKFRAQRDAMRRTLNEIAAMETPRCASIGKRMAAAARAGVKADGEVARG